MCWRNAMFQYNHHVFNMYMFQFFYSSSPTCWAMKRCNDAAEPAPWERYKRARGPPMVPQPQDSQSTPLAAGPTQAQEGVPGTSPVPESTELDDVLNFLVDKSQEMSGQHADGGSDTAGTAASSSSSGLPKEEIATAPPMDPSVVENKAKVENTKYTMGPSKKELPYCTSSFGWAWLKKTSGWPLPNEALSVWHTDWCQKVWREKWRWMVTIFSSFRLAKKNEWIDCCMEAWRST